MALQEHCLWVPTTVSPYTTTPYPSTMSTTLQHNNTTVNVTLTTHNTTSVPATNMTTAVNTTVMTTTEQTGVFTSLSQPYCMLTLFWLFCLSVNVVGRSWGSSQRTPGSDWRHVFTELQPGGRPGVSAGGHSVWVHHQPGSGKHLHPDCQQSAWRITWEASLVLQEVRGLVFTLFFFSLAFRP